jgi:putative glutamine amidotransferase
VPLTPDSLSLEEVTPGRAEALLDANEIEGILLTGGGDVDPTLYGGDPDSAIQVNRARDEFEIALIKAALRKNIPILGICRGCQILNVANGGDLVNLRDDAKQKESHFNFSGHKTDITLGSRLAEALQETHLENVYSFHGQAVDRPGKGIAVVARGPGGVVEAIEMAGPNELTWAVGVQWHPEMAVNDEIQNRLFGAFVRECMRRRAQRNIGPG